MKSNLTFSIIKTLCYSQTFSYPLTISELHKYLIYKKKITKNELYSQLHKNKNFFMSIGQYVVLPGDIKLIQERNARVADNRKKFAKALWVSNLLRHIPSIKLIGISGSLSMFNAKKNDDIDLFFITTKDTLWITRFFVNFLLLILGEKRRRGERLAKDEICPNMFMSENKLLFSQRARSLYMAHEIAQLKVLYAKDNIYNKFLNKNSWVLRYLPNAFEKSKVEYHKNKSNIFKFTIEYVFFKLQLIYMKRKMTNEKVGKNYAFFHPTDQKKTVEYLYKLKVKTYANLLKDYRKEEIYSLRTAIN